MYSVISVGLLNSETWTKCGHEDSLCGLGLCFRDNKIREGKMKNKKEKRKCPLQNNNNNNNNNNNEILMAVTINYPVVNIVGPINLLANPIYSTLTIRKYDTLLDLFFLQMNVLSWWKMSPGYPFLEDKCL